MSYVIDVEFSDDTTLESRDFNNLPEAVAWGQLQRAATFETKVYVTGGHGRDYDYTELNPGETASGFAARVKAETAETLAEMADDMESECHHLGHYDATHAEEAPSLGSRLWPATCRW